ncbi:beta-lactamase family protein [Belliella sp. DSM 111904]|uniref:Beta-lactamase family protein n=1 Tax=Belliella filtrata TaxID=2923435 RepID=A0ABS9V530_9BACT|nr:serine hydrolase [Belliella filtrata]MCH7411324.1 beta-lactamase family protein [Belliella filtrata]
MKSLIGIILVLLLGSCLSEEPFKKQFQTFVPQELDDGWELSSPEEQSMNSQLLKRAFELVYREERYVMARSLLVFRNGKLIAEAYPNDPDDAHKIANIQSCTKSITSILVGVAMEKGMVENLDIRFYDLFPELFDDKLTKRHIRIKDALSMQTGLEFDNDKHTLQLYQKKNNSIQWMLSKSLLYPPGSYMNYNDGAPHMVSKTIETLTMQPAASFAEKFLFEPLGIKDWMWESSSDGVTYGAFSLFLTPRDLGKIGQLVLQNGIWGKQQIISSKYMEEATSIQAISGHKNQPYGYYFWLYPEWNAFAALGHGGQFLLMVPDKNLVVVYTAWPYTHHQLWDHERELMELIIQSCT